MNEQERRKALYDAMGSIDPALVEQATHHRKNRRISLILRIVLVLIILAVLAYTVLTLPDWKDRLQRNTNGFQITAAYVDEVTGEKTQVVLTDGASIQVEYPSFVFDAFRQEIVLTVSVPDEFAGAEISISIHTEVGTFKQSDLDADISFAPDSDNLANSVFLSSLYGQRFEIENGKQVFWTPVGIDYEQLMQHLENNNPNIQNKDYWFFQDANPAYIYIRIYADYQLVGYGLIRVTRTPLTREYALGAYTFEVLANTTFPLIDGEFQRLPYCDGNASYVNALIKWDKENN